MQRCDYQVRNVVAKRFHVYDKPGVPCRTNLPAPGLECARARWPRVWHPEVLGPLRNTPASLLGLIAEAPQRTPVRVSN